jgi:sugar phosphate isomerase/epimerase
MAKAPDWLGMVCQGRSVEEVISWLEAAAAHGFKTVQPVFFWSGYGAVAFTAVKTCMDRLGLKAAAFGVYSDIYKWDKPIGAVFEGTAHDLETAIDCAHLLDTQQVVSWCGSQDAFAEPCPENRSPAVIDNFKENLRRLLPRLSRRGIRLLFEPWHAHILKDEHATALTCMSAPGHLGCVLDFPNFIQADEWEDRKARIASIRKVLEPHIGIIHLKDMTVSESGEVGSAPLRPRRPVTRDRRERFTLHQSKAHHRGTL